MIDNTNSRTWAAGVRHTKSIGHITHLGGVSKNEGKKKCIVSQSHTRKNAVLNDGRSINSQMSSLMVGPRCDKSAHSS